MLSSSLINTVSDISDVSNSINNGQGKVFVWFLFFGKTKDQMSCFRFNSTHSLQSCNRIDTSSAQDYLCQIGLQKNFLLQWYQVCGNMMNVLVKEFVTVGLKTKVNTEDGTQRATYKWTDDLRK